MAALFWLKVSRNVTVKKSAGAAVVKAGLRQEDLLPNPQAHTLARSLSASTLGTTGLLDGPQNMATVTPQRELTKRKEAAVPFKTWSPKSHFREKWGDIGHRVQTFSCKIKRLWGSNV